MALWSFISKSNFLTAICLIFATTPLYAQWLSGFEFRKAITISDTTISGALPLENFPLLISLTDNDLRTTANGGGVTNSSGYDIAFTNTSGTSLPFELESYNPSTGQVVAWVNVNSISAVSSTVIYIYYGNNSISTNQSSSSAWNANFGGSWNLSDFNDGTANAYTLTNNSTVDTVGKIARARYVNGTGTQSLTVNKDAIANTGYFAISFWMRPAANSGTVFDFSAGTGATSDPYFYFNYNASLIRFALESENDADVNFTFNTSLALGTWYHITCIGQHGGNDHRLYLNGNQVATNNVALDGKASDLDNGRIGDINALYGSAEGRYHGSIDNFWIYNALPTNDWINALYKNQNNPSNFYTVGVEECNAENAAGTLYGPAQVDSGTVVNLALSSYNSSASFQWQTSTDGINFTDVIGATSATLTTPAITATRYYRVVATVNGCVDVSNVHTIFISNNFLSGYFYRKQIQIEADMVCGSSSLANFPVLLKFTDPDLAAANDKIVSGFGYDIVFTTEDGETLLDHQLEKFDSTTGSISVWVRIPNLSPSANTTILMNYGNCSITTDQSVNTVWNVNYETVWHMGSNLTDRSQNTNNLTNTGTTIVNGITGDARNFNGTSQYLTGPDIDLAQGTVSAWVQFTNTHNNLSTQTRPVFNKYVDANNQFVLLFAGTDNSYDNDGQYYFKIEGSTTFGRETAAQNTWTAGVWYYISASWGTTQGVGINGVTVASNSRNNQLEDNANIIIGGGDVDQTSGSFEYFEGIIDEIHITNTVRNDDWLCTEYNNISNPAAYISLGTEQSNFQWSGAVSSDWNDGGNWAGCKVPSSISDIVINSSAVNFPVITANQTVKSISINSGASLTVNNATLTVTGNFTINGTYNCSNGKIRFAGSNTQNLFGSATIQFCDLEIENTSTGNSLILNTPIAIIDSLILKDGIIKGSATNKVTLNNGSTASAGNSNAHVDAPLTKIGATPFAFPVGNNAVFGGIEISDPINNAATDQFTATYLRAAPNYAFEDSSDFGGDNDDLYNVSTAEHWNLSRDVGAAEVILTLKWRNGESGIEELSEIVIAHNASDSTWVNEGGIVTGTADSGQVVTVNRLGSFSPFTFGSIGESNPLPVKLKHFSAQCTNNITLVEWSTLSEINHRKFELQRSENGFDFKNIHELTVDNPVIYNGLKNYRFVDDFNQNQNPHYYRLKQTDFDGKSEILAFKAVQCNEKLNPSLLQIYPNPTASFVRLEYLNTAISATAETSIQLTDISGKLLNTWKLTSPHHQVLDLSNLASGTYFISILENQEVKATTPLFKE